MKKRSTKRDSGVSCHLLKSKKKIILFTGVILLLLIGSGIYIFSRTNPEQSNFDHNTGQAECRGADESAECRALVEDDQSEGSESLPDNDAELYNQCLERGFPEASCQALVEENKPELDLSQHETFEYGEVTRHYLIHTPSNLPADAPLLFMLHSYMGSAEETQSATNLNQIADKHGFVVVYPQGVVDIVGSTHWNAKFTLSLTDDIGFLSNLASSIQQEYNLDPSRTYVAGISNGGFMSYVLAMEAPDVFHGAASIIGTMSGASWASREAGSSFPLLQISGVDDEVVPIDGSLDTIGGAGGAPAMDVIIEYWGDRNQCLKAVAIKTNEFTALMKHQDCEDGNDIWYYKIENFGHELPDANNSAGFDVAEAIWDFFSGINDGSRVE